MLNGISAIVTGYSHIAVGKECQDYVELNIENKEYAMAAAADGHGSDKHFRSAKGSQFAAEAAKESIGEYMKDYEKFVEAYELNKEYLVDRIIKMVITKWHEKIQQDLMLFPITEEEIDKYLGGNFNKSKVASIYGTTLLVGVISEKCNFGFLIGDGSFVVINKYGKAYIPIEDENSRANYTSSLSSSDSYNGFVKHFFEEMPFSMMLSTDGLVKSFGNDNDFLDYNQAIAMELGKIDSDEKKDNLEEKLQALFDQRSKDGSEDDISISIIFNTEGFENVLTGLKTRRSINKLEGQIQESNKKLVSLNFREKQIRDEKRTNAEELSQLIMVRKHFEEKNKQCKEKIEKLREQIKKIEEEQKTLEESILLNEKKNSQIISRITECQDFDKQKEAELQENQQKINDEQNLIKEKEVEKSNLQSQIDCE